MTTSLAVAYLLTGATIAHTGAATATNPWPPLRCCLAAIAWPITLVAWIVRAALSSLQSEPTR